MKAVIYARYSTDKQREASIDDQVRNCRAYAEREGWQVQDVYLDEAISGSTSHRPGYQKLLKAAEQGIFQVLIVDDLSRLSRDDVEMKQVVRRFRFKQMRIIGVSDGFDSDSKSHKIQAGVRGLINEIYIDDLRDKTHRGLTGQALKGYNCGGRTYGYKHIPLEDHSRKDEFGRPLITAVKREVDPEQAEWVRQIFTWYADGYSPRWIADSLNKAGVPSTHGGKWAASAIYGDMRRNTGMLNNEMYIGKYTWNRSQWVKDPDSGQRKRLLRPEEEWVVKDMPELRIITQELWDRVKGRQKSQQEKSTNIRLALHKNARMGASPKYLFSSLLKCGCCGGNYIMVDYYRYGCAVHKDRGPNACANSIKITRKLLESRLLAAIKSDLFTAEGLEWFKKETSRILMEKKKQAHPDIDLMQKRLQDAEKEIENIMNAIKAGIITPTVKEQLQKAERKRDELRDRLLVDDRKVANMLSVLPRVTEMFKEKLTNMEMTSPDHIAKLRHQISALVGGEITLRPFDGDGLTAELYGQYAGLFDFVLEKSKFGVVAGARFELTTFRL